MILFEVLVKVIVSQAGELWFGRDYALQFVSWTETVIEGS